MMRPRQRAFREVARGNDNLAVATRRGTGPTCRRRFLKTGSPKPWLLPRAAGGVAIAEASWQGLCPACESAFISPRTDPVVIILITRHEPGAAGRIPRLARRDVLAVWRGSSRPGETIEGGRFASAEQ